jgi:prophage regulatory protein
VRIILIDEVKARTGLGRSSIYEKLKTGELPKPVKRGTRGVGWIDKEIDAYVAARIAERDSTAA